MIFQLKTNNTWASCMTHCIILCKKLRYVLYGLHFLHQPGRPSNLHQSDRWRDKEKESQMQSNLTTKRRPSPAGRGQLNPVSWTTISISKSKQKCIVQCRQYRHDLQESNTNTQTHTFLQPPPILQHLNAQLPSTRMVIGPAYYQDVVGHSCIILWQHCFFEGWMIQKLTPLFWLPAATYQFTNLKEGILVTIPENTLPGTNSSHLK